MKEKDFPDYYRRIEKPMDLSKIRMKINNNVYESREQMLDDYRLIYANSVEFNGKLQTRSLAVCISAADFAVLMSLPFQGHSLLMSVSTRNLSILTFRKLLRGTCAALEFND